MSANPEPAARCLRHDYRLTAGTSARTKAVWICRLCGQQRENRKPSRRRGPVGKLKASAAAAFITGAITLTAACGGGDVQTRPGPTAVAPVMSDITTATATATPATSPTAAPTATAAPAPTATTAPTPADSDRITFPTLTPTAAPPTATAAPTLTPVPTPRPGNTAADPDICRRTPEVQYALMDHLDINLCRAITVGELFRITGLTPSGANLELRHILHPDDLAGLVNLRRFDYYEGSLDYVDFSHTPEMRRIDIGPIIESWPPGFTFAAAPKLEYIAARITGAAACQMLERETLRRVFGDPGDRAQPLTLNIDVYYSTDSLPDTTQGQRDFRYGMAMALADAIGTLDAIEVAARDDISPRQSFSTDAEYARYRDDIIRAHVLDSISVGFDDKLAACN